ncbi:MAG TPA: glycosyl hydrolase family 28-related protein [Bacteroidales bacterium]|nr:glycosyl hydrolase family 28-related protein [Bacteroidales bacterium]
MKRVKTILTCLLLVLAGLNNVLLAKDPRSISVYQQKPVDPLAVYFTANDYNIKADGKMDVSAQLQAAINKIETEIGYGILFIPEGKYLVTKTIYVPGSVRLIGYGANRPEIILGKNSPGFQTLNADSRYPENYLIFFTGGLVTEGRPAGDAGAGTFYSAISNIDLTIQDGNPLAVAMRTHYAQHGFFNHMIINAGKGRACISEAGNEIEDVVFLGGDYGITANQTSPSWPVAMIDTYFEGQRKAAIQSNNTGFAIVNMHVKNVPVAVEIKEGEIDRLFMENCLLDNVKTAGVVISIENHAQTQVNMLNVSCRNVPVLASYRQSGKKVEVSDKIYSVKEFVYGLIMDDMAANSGFKEIKSIEPLQQFPVALTKDIPALPGMETWVNIRDLGAKGDGETDDTKAFNDAIAKHNVIYVPQGFYRITGTVKMAPGTRLIGLHPWGTQFILKESEPAFSGFGAPVAMVESSEGGDDILNGIGITTGGYNYRAVACKWMAGKDSYMNDIKFVGGHGTLRPVRSEGGQNRQGGFGFGQRNISSPTNPVPAQGLDLAWDNQYWSLWITNNGGGTFKDLWTANTYATSGLFVSNTSTPSRVYAISLEHHVRNEARFENVSNWKLYAFQLEEESREGKECQSVELSNCRSIRFNNFWNYRVIRVTTPKQYGVRVWNCEDVEFRNVKNYTQKLVVTEFPIYDVNRKLPVYPWELAKVTITGSEKTNKTISLEAGKVEKLATGFYFPTGITSDSKGNIYFCETLKKRIYKWSSESNTMTLLADYPLQPFALSTDTKDNLLVTFRYDPQPGFNINGKQETVKKLPDDNPGYSGWGNSGWATLMYSINPANAEATFTPLVRKANSQLSGIKRVIYPSSRYRGDFLKQATYWPDSSFVATDGVTIIPEIYDLGRCASLSAAKPGQTFYTANELPKKFYSFNVEPNGHLSGMKEILGRGEYGYAVDNDGNLYVADGQIFVYDKTGKEIKRINVEERPIAICFGGTGNDTLFIITDSSLFGLKIK